MVRPAIRLILAALFVLLPVMQWRVSLRAMMRESPLFKGYVEAVEACENGGR